MLSEQFERYVALRRSMGAQLQRPQRYLLSYSSLPKLVVNIMSVQKTALGLGADGADAGSTIRMAQPACASAKFLRAEDPAHEVPPTHLFTVRRTRTIPYIYTPEELTRMLVVARQVSWRTESVLYKQVYVMLFGLIRSHGTACFRGTRASPE